MSLRREIHFLHWDDMLLHRQSWLSHTENMFLRRGIMFLHVESMPLHTTALIIDQFRFLELKREPKF